MIHLRRVSPRARAASLLALGALAVHQLRYLIAYGSTSGGALAHQGHGYLTQLAPVVAGLAIAALAATLIAAALRERAPTGRARVPVGPATLLFAGGLVAIFSTQELTEGALAAGHPHGLDALLAHGGYLAAPLALAIGALAALATRAIEGAERLLVGILVGRPSGRVRARRELAVPPTSCRRRPLAALALGFGFARRPPPRPLLNG